MELSQPLQDRGLVEGHVRMPYHILSGTILPVLGFSERLAGQMENLHRRVTVPDEVVDEEVVQFVRADQILGLLLDLSL